MGTFKTLSMPVPHRRVDPEVFRTILRAVRKREALAVLY